MRTIAPVPGLLVAVTLVVTALEVAAQGKSPDRALRIAVVDPTQVLRESKWAQRLQEQVRNEADELRGKQASLEAEIQKKAKDLKEVWTEGTREHDSGKCELAVLKARHETSAEMYSSWLQRRQVEFELTVLQEIEREVQGLAAKRELDLVLRRQSETTRDQRRSALGRLNAMFDNPVFYAAPDLDITKDVISLLDNRMNTAGAPVEASGNSSKTGPGPSKAPDVPAPSKASGNTEKK